MLSLSGVTSAQGLSYFEKDDYYFSAGEGRGELGWEGKAVSREEFEALVRERIEATGGRLDGKNRIADDLTFSAPKSVSLVAAFDDQMRDQVIEAHREAVREVLNYIEESGMIQARDEAGNPTAAKGAVAVAFDHFLSRNMDPQLHTHVLLANRVERTDDGKLVSTYLREVYVNKKALGAMYRLELASRLERLGFEVEWRRDGTFELKGFSEEQLRAFSTRREEIEERLAELGFSGGKAAEIAAKDTREAKRNITPGAIRATIKKLWEEKAREVGLELPRPGEHGADPVSGLVAQEDKNVEAKDAVLKVMETAGFANQVRLELEVAKALAREGLTARVDEIKDLTAGALSEAAEGRGGKITLTEDRMGRERFTFHDHLSAELRTREFGICKPKASVSEERAKKIFDRFNRELERERGFRLTGEQEKAVLQIAASKEDAVLLGRAGTGKTTALEALKKIYEYQGNAVVGVAPSGLAAKNLEREAGIKSFTVDSLVFLKVEKHFGSAEALKGGLLVVDEAGMVDARRAAAVMEFAQKYDMKILWVGDPDQLKPVGAGDPFGRFVTEAAERGSLFELTEIKRQKDPDYREAALLAASGRTVEALTKLETKGWVQEIAAKEERMAAVVQEYLSAIQEGKRGLVVTESNVIKDLLNREIRLNLKREGLLEEDGLMIEVRDTGGKTVGEREFAVGDTVMFLRNNRELGVKNGEVGKVVSVDTEARLLMIETQDGIKSLSLDTYNFLDYGYAVTVHKSQGQTVDRVIYAAETGSRQMSANLFYVAVTRGRESVSVITDDREKLAERIALPQDKKDVLSWRAGSVAENGEEKLERDIKVLREGRDDFAVLNQAVDLEKYARFSAEEAIRRNVTESAARETWRELPDEVKLAVITAERAPSRIVDVSRGVEEGVVKAGDWYPKDVRVETQKVAEVVFTLPRKDGLSPEEREKKEAKHFAENVVKYGFGRAQYYRALNEGDYSTAKVLGHLAGVDPDRIRKDVAVEKAVRGEEDPRSIWFQLKYGWETAKEALDRVEKIEKVQAEAEAEKRAIIADVKGELARILNEEKKDLGPGEKLVVYVDERNEKAEIYKISMDENSGETLKDIVRESSSLEDIRDEDREKDRGEETSRDTTSESFSPEDDRDEDREKDGESGSGDQGMEKDMDISF